MQQLLYNMYIKQGYKYHWNNLCKLILYMHSWHMWVFQSTIKKAYGCLRPVYKQSKKGEQSNNIA